MVMSLQLEESEKSMKEKNEMTNEDLIGKCFYYINSFKRHRALAHIRRIEGDSERAIYHELKQYQFIDSLELALRAIQKGAREIDDFLEGEEKQHE